jgi:hypothetical protein
MAEREGESCPSVGKRIERRKERAERERKSGTLGISRDVLLQSVPERRIFERSSKGLLPFFGGVRCTCGIACARTDQRQSRSSAEGAHVGYFRTAVLSMKRLFVRVENIVGPFSFVTLRILGGSMG